MTPPFTYPAGPHVRRHSPHGYSSYSGFRDWLRDEFSFRCAYCLLRERWVPGGFHLDHFLPVAAHPEFVTDYDNLIYCCATCNAAKGHFRIPDPTRTLTAETISTHANGSLIASTAEAAYLIEHIGLNRPRYCQFRRLWIAIVAACRTMRPDMLREVLGYPDDLPDLSALRPPAGNSRPNGIAESAYARRTRGALSETY